MYANYQEIREAIARRQSFKGNSCKGIKTSEGYTIYSYATIVYYETNVSPFGHLDTSFYSATTSKLQGIIAEAMNGKNLKELRGEKKKEAQKIDYSKLYYDKEIKVSKEGFASGRPIALDIRVNDFHILPFTLTNADCQIGHFGYNIYYRTNAGINLKQYTTRARLQKAVENRLKKEGFTILEWIDK